MRSALAAFALLAGCYHPSYDDCAVSCAQSGKCPSGLECVLGMCRSMEGPCGGGDIDAPGLGGWRFRKKLTIGNAGASVKDFPVLIRITDIELMNYAQPSGADIRFTDAGGSALPHQIELYDDGTGALVAWVKVPSLVLSVATDIYMYFGNPTASDQQTPAAVWDASYVGVWHMGDPPGTKIADSTSAMRTGTKGAANAPVPIPGLMGGAHSFQGSQSDYFGLVDASGLDLDTLTIEAWIKFSGSNTSATRQFYGVPAAFTNQPYLIYQDPTSTGDKGRYLVPKLPTNETYTTQSGKLMALSWTHVMVTWSGGTPSVYSNGAVQQLVLSASPATASPDLVSIGGSASGFDSNTLGIVDEVRLSNVARSQAYAVAVTTFGAEGAMSVTEDKIETLF